MSNARPRIVPCLLALAASLLGCSAEVPTADELALLEQEGAYSPEVAVSAQPLLAVERSTGFVLMHDPGVTTPSVAWSYNHQGGTNSYSRMGVGRYRVTMPYLTLGGNAQVSAYGQDTARCTLSGRPTSGAGAVNVGVYCYNPDGTPVDTMFVAFYHNHEKSLGSTQAYGVAEYSKVAGVPTMTLQDSRFTSAVKRTALGYYNVLINGEGSGTAFVTPISTTGSLCSVTDYNAAGDRFTVHCFDKSGADADVSFSFLFMREASFFGLHHASAHTTVKADHSPVGHYAVQGEDVLYVDWDQQGAGKHRVEMYNPYKISISTTTLVTHQGNGTSFCKPLSHGTSGTTMSVLVACYNLAGDLVNSHFSVMSAWKDPGLLLVN